MKSLAVIGGGPAGIAAAKEAKNNGIDRVVIFERNEYLGGVLPQCIHDGFGLHYYKENLTGPEYANRNIEELKKLDIEIYTDCTVLNILEKNNGYELEYCGLNLGSKSIYFDSIIFAMGCRERNRGHLRIPGTRPAGIFTAGSAQYMMNIQNYKLGKNAVILGSGDVGLIMARRLTLEGTKVKLILGEVATGLKRNVVQCVKDFDIPLLYGYTIVNIHGYKRLKGVTILNKKNNQTKYIPCDTLLIAAGLVSENELARNLGVNLNNWGGIIIDKNNMTNKKGVFACGNVVEIYDLADNVSYAGKSAGRNAADYLFNREFSNKNSQKRKFENRESTLKSDMVCILCPKSCELIIDKSNENIKISGNKCKKGENYALEEMINPKRVVTSTVKINSHIPLLPVRTDKAVSKSEIFKIVKEIKKINIEAPIKIGTIIKENICNTGANLISTETRLD